MYRPSEEFLPSPSPTVPMEPWRRALMDAAEYIRVHGHCKGIYEAQDGRVCLYGALRKVYGVKGGNGTPVEIFEVAQRVTPYPIDFNDAPGRTAAEVIAALEAAARS